jgi:hypothetical protein
LAREVVSVKKEAPSPTLPRKGRESGCLNSDFYRNSEDINMNEKRKYSNLDSFPSILEGLGEAFIFGFRKPVSIMLLPGH